MDRTSYTNLAKSWEYVEDHAFSRQSAELNAIRTAAEEAGIPQGSAAQAELLRMLVRMLDASSVIAIGTGSVVETMQLINGLDNAGQLTAVDSSTQGIALIRKLFNRLSDDTETTLRAVNASAGVFLPPSERRELRFNRRGRRSGELCGGFRAGSTPAETACRDCLHRCTCL